MGRDCVPGAEKNARHQVILVVHRKYLVSLASCGVSHDPRRSHGTRAGLPVPQSSSYATPDASTASSTSLPNDTNSPIAFRCGSFLLRGHAGENDDRMQSALMHFEQGRCDPASLQSCGSLRKRNHEDSAGNGAAQVIIVSRAGQRMLSSRRFRGRRCCKASPERSSC